MTVYKTKKECWGCSFIACVSSAHIVKSYKRLLNQRCEVESMPKQFSLTQESEWLPVIMQHNDCRSKLAAT